ncbi:MAG TPA: VC0807 family protein [Acidimicrobiales bacterium]|nr:VC0807 family protein [Acidimicrobiales bacterium]
MDTPTHSPEETPAPTPQAAWEPGVPSIREMLPSVIGGAAVPLTVYYLVRHHVRTDAEALIIAGIFPAAWVVLQFVRQRRIDPIGTIVLLGFGIGVTTSLLLGGNAYVLKARDSVFTAVFGIICLISLVVAERPAIFYIGRFMSAGNDPERVAAYDQLHHLPGGQRTFSVLTAVWGIGLLAEASCRLTLAAFLPTGTFLAISPIISAVCIGAMFFFTVRYTKRARVFGAALLAEGEAYPSVPLR